MLKKSTSTPTLSKLANQRMVKSNSSTSISDMLSVNDGPKWTINDVQHVAIFTPLNNVAKCMVSHTFPGSILSDGDDSNLDMGLCMVDPGYAENLCKDECDFEKCIKNVRRVKNDDEIENENENVEDGIENQKLFFENQK